MTRGSIQLGTDPNPCAKAKFRAGKLVSQSEREQAVTMECGRVAAAFLADAERSAAERLADA
jgi:hypothetical protein